LEGENKLRRKLKLIKAFIYCSIFFSFLLNNFSYSFSEVESQKTEITTQPAPQATQKAEKTPASPAITAESAILIDASTGITLYEKNADKKLYPASTTKILTSLITIENCKPTEKVKHSHEAIYGIGPGSSNIGMKENEEITIEQALHGILLASANEVCVAVAEHIGGNLENFMKMANERLQLIGATNTHFANPHGFHDDNHYTTARDMSLIMKEAVKNETFVKIISTYSYTIPPTNIVNEKRPLHNTNKFINPYNNFHYDYCIGGKTGFTDEAGNTLVTYFQKDGIKLICVVLKDQGTNTYVDSKALAEYGFGLFEEKELFNKNDYTGIIDGIQYFHKKKIDLGKASVIPKDSFKTKVPKNIDTNKIKTLVSLPDEKEGALKIGDTVGEIEIVYSNGKTVQSLGKVDLISNTNIDTISEDVLQEKENMEIFWQNTLRILIIAGISIVSIGIIIALVILIKKYKSNKENLHL